MVGMTTLDTSVLSAFAPQPARRTDSLLDDLRSGTPWAIAFGGQGGDWLEPLAGLVRDHALEADVADLVRRAERLLEPVAYDLARAGVPFEPIAWVDVLAVGEDRKSTRLNSSHVKISYAVFCLRRKKRQ